MIKIERDVRLGFFQPAAPGKLGELNASTWRKHGEMFEVPQL